jgi:heme exporter protein C
MKKLAIGVYLLITVALLGWAYYQAIDVAPNDAMQGEIFRIFYYHVPNAMLCFLFFFLNLVGSVWFLAAAERKKAGGAFKFSLKGLIVPPIITLVVLLVIGLIVRATVDPAVGNYISDAGLGLALLWVAVYLILRSIRLSPDQQMQIADALAVAAAEIGVVFATVVLITGPIWGRRAWGIWWTWDARLTTTLVLWLIYTSYLLLRRFAAGPQMQTLAAVLGIFGALDVPIVYMSNRWWRTQHPAPVFGGAQGSGMDSSMLPAFFWNLAAWAAWGLLILALRYHVEREHQRIVAAEAEAALNA